MIVQQARGGRDCHRAVTTPCEQTVHRLGGRVRVGEARRHSARELNVYRSSGCLGRAGHQVNRLRSVVGTILLVVAVAAVMFGGDLLFGGRLP